VRVETYFAGFQLGFRTIRACDEVSHGTSGVVLRAFAGICLRSDASSSKRLR
jgi:hypothetical protein